MFLGTFWRCGENLECVGVKMREIREFIGRIFRNPRYWSRSTGIWSRSARLPDGAEPDFEGLIASSKWPCSRSFEKNFGSDLCWSRAKNCKGSRSFENFVLSDLLLIASSTSLIAISLLQIPQSALFSALELPSSSRMTCLYFLRLVFTISTVFTSSPRLN